MATPALLAKVEYTAKEYLREALAEEETSVGTSISVKHRKPSKVGSIILIKVTVDSQEKNKIDFSFQVFQEDSLIAEGTHQRAVILTIPFLKKLDLLS